MGAKTFSSHKIKKVWGGGGGAPLPTPLCIIRLLAMQDIFGASSIHRLSIFYGYQSWIWTNFSIRYHHLF
jgi:hypothetical protein